MPNETHCGILCATIETGAWLGRMPGGTQRLSRARPLGHTDGEQERRHPGAARRVEMNQYELRRKIRKGEAADKCAIQECRRSVYAKGLCRMHYERERRKRRKDD